MKIYKKFELESNFIEITNPRKSNIIIGVTYKHPKMDVTDFNCNFLNNFLKNISQEQKGVYLMHYHEQKPTQEFLESLKCQARHQEFFRAGEISENKGTSTNI